MGIKRSKRGGSMKLSTKGRYGLRALIDLAMHCETEAVSISCIAMRQGISESYLEQLMGKLRKAGLIVSVRGAQGDTDWQRMQQRSLWETSCEPWKAI